MLTEHEIMVSLLGFLAEKVGYCQLVLRAAEQQPDLLNDLLLRTFGAEICN